MFSCTASCKVVADSVLVVYSCSYIVIIIPMNSDADNVTLCEDEVAGASLRGRDVGSLKIPELKHWL